MDRYQGSIVVGVDGSRSSMRALEWAADQARCEHRPLTLVHTMTTTASAYMSAAMVDLVDAHHMLEMSGRAMLYVARTEVERLAPGIEVLEVLEYADPGDRLVTMSRDAAMVVVGSHGRGPVRSKLLGSVSVRLTRHAHCPVVVIRPSDPAAVRSGVVVGLDALPESQPVLEFAYREAAVRRLPLIVLHASWWSAGARSLEAAYIPVTPAEREADRVSVAGAMAAMAERYPEVSARSRLIDGRAEDALVRMGEHMDLVVVGTHQTRGLGRALFGSVSVSVVERATCPVAVVPVSTGRLHSSPDVFDTPPRGRDPVAQPERSSTDAHARGL
jgi:nucleotide-binding universal stress UspA family protein